MCEIYSLLSHLCIVSVQVPENLNIQEKLKNKVGLFYFSNNIY